jgi:muramoyltetrapeptide carboxypeptidase
MRRDVFVRSLAGVAGGSLVAGCSDSSDAGRKPEPTHAVEPTAAPAGLPATAAPVVRASTSLRKPLRLRQGQTVGLVAPASSVSAADLGRARRFAELLGVRVKLGAHVHAEHGYLAGTDDERLDDFNAFVRDPDVRAIFALRGGYGTMRILDDIDYAGLGADPKIVLGFSDLTALLNAITSRTGLVTFHGLVAGHSTNTPNVIGSVQRAFMSREPLELRAPESRTFSAGSAHGPLVGGNLSLVAALCGTPYAVPCAGNILLLEDVKEEPYQVDRTLTQLMLNELKHVAGVALGQFVDCLPTERPSLTVEQTLEDRLGRLNKPILSNLPVGHIDEQWTLPLGLTAELDASRHAIRFAESAVE